MPFVQKCSDQLREHVNKTLTPQIQALEDELRNLYELLAKGICDVGYKLEALRNTELPTTELILNDYLGNVARKLDINGKMLALFTRGLRTKETQEEILASLLDNAVNCFPCVALFTVRGDVFSGWSSRGFSDLTAGTISSDELSKDICSWLMGILRNKKRVKCAKLPDIGSFSLMSDESTGAWRLYPLHVLGRPVAILLAGEAEDSGGRPETLAALIDCATLQLENVALKIIKTLSESLPEVADNPSFIFSSNQQQMAAISPDVLNPDLTVPINIPEHAEAPGHPDEQQTNPAAGLKHDDHPSATVVYIPVAASSEHEQETVTAGSDDDAEQTAEASQPPQATDDEILHAATKRFAELLVSGIKFYNEHAIIEGRKNRDLYKRLQQSIIRNRKMYEKRVAPAVAEKIDYLHEELVRILADGDAGAFGDCYPGPVIGGPERIIKF